MTVYTRGTVEGLLNTELQAFAQQWLACCENVQVARNTGDEAEWCSAVHQLLDADEALLDADEEMQAWLRSQRDPDIGRDDDGWVDIEF